MQLIHFGRALVTVMVLVGVAPLDATADEDQVDLKDVPASVHKAADEAVSRAEWMKATRETDDEETTYHLYGADAKGREVNITLTDEGEVDVLETVLSVTDLPARIVEVLRTLPQVKWTDATERLEDGETSYEVGGSDLKDRESSAYFPSDGRPTIYTDRESSDVPAAVTKALKARLPTFQDEKVRSITEDGTLVGYLFIGKEGADIDEMEVKVSPDGKTVKVLDDDDES